MRCLPSFCTLLFVAICLLQSPWSNAQELRDELFPPPIERLPADRPVGDDPYVFYEPSAPQSIDESETASSMMPNDGPMSGSRAPFNAKMFWLPNQPLQNVPGHWSQSGEQLNLAVPIFIAPEGGNIWLATGGVSRMEISTSAVLPDSLLAVPDQLWKVHVGTMNFRELDNGWKTGAILNVGSASDQPFAGIRDMTVNAIGFLKIPVRERDAWSFSLFYSPTSQLPFPVPGIAYEWRPTDFFSANLGIPFSLQYRPTETFSFSMSYTPLTNVQVLAKQQLTDAWSLYGGYQITNDTYWLADRTDNNERFYLFDQRLAVGLDRKLGLGFRLDFSVAYVFDRRVFQAQSFSEDRRDQIEINPGLAATLQLIWSR